MPTPQVNNSSAPPVAQTNTWGWEEFICLAILLIWPVVGIVLFGRAVVASVRFASRLRRIPAVSDPATVEMLADVCRTMLIRRVPLMKYVPGLSSPALFGCLRPILCLPETQQPLSRDELRMIIIHEMAHLVRYDGYVAWLLKLVQAVHWFNPLAWFVTRQVAHTRELACDEAVRRFTAASDHRTYGDLIVRFASTKPTVNLGLVGLWFARPIRRLKTRVAACAAERQSRWRLPRPVCLALLAIVACVGLTDRAPSSVIEPPTRLQPFPASPETLAAAEAAIQRYLDPRPEGSEAIEEREYDIALALSKLAEADPKADPLDWLLTHIRPDGEDCPKPALVASDRDAGRITLRMSRNEHAGFADALAGISRSGPWMVDIAVRFFRVNDLEQLGDLKWDVVDNLTRPVNSEGLQWRQGNSNEASISMSSIITSYEPFTTSLLSHDQMHHAIRSIYRDRRNPMPTAPRLTLSNGAKGMVWDQAYVPYVTGLERSSDPAKQTLKPVISVLSEGTRIELRGDVVDSETLELSCRAIFSEIKSVVEGRLPGTDQLVQVPNVNQVILQAHSVRFAPGQSFVVAPIMRLRERDKPVDSMCFAMTPTWTRATAPQGKVSTEDSVYIDETAGAIDAEALSPGATAVLPTFTTQFVVKR